MRSGSRGVLFVGLGAVLGVLVAIPPANATPGRNHPVRSAAAARAKPGWHLLLNVTGPKSRSQAALAYDAATKQVIMFGGATAEGAHYGDTWSWTGKRWARLHPAHSPSARWDASIGYDPATRQLVLFGGFNPVTGLTDRDTWVWSGKTWTKRAPASRPPSRDGAPMAYDSASKQLLLFGGSGAGILYSDTWTWTGRTWRRLTPSGSPPARSDASMAYDGATRQVVLFGGDGIGGTSRQDTWTWSGKVWRPTSPKVEPDSGNQNDPLAYDPVTKRLLLLDIGVYTWNGTTWSKPSFANIPDDYNGMMTFDAARKNVVLFQDTHSGTGNQYGETWLYH